MTLENLWWLNYLMPSLLLFIALLLSVGGIVIHIRSKNRQRKHEQLSAMYYKSTWQDAHEKATWDNQKVGRDGYR